MNKHIFFGLVVASLLLVGCNNSKSNEDSSKSKESSAKSIAESKMAEGFAAIKNKQYDNAFKLFNEACDLGNGGSCYNLGLMYKKGDGVKQDKFKAVELYRKACDLGNGDGCNNLGVMYSKGEGIRQDIKKAKELYGKACDLKVEVGCENYASMNY